MAEFDLRRLPPRGACPVLAPGWALREWGNPEVDPSPIGTVEKKWENSGKNTGRTKLSAGLRHLTK